MWVYITTKPYSNTYDTALYVKVYNNENLYAISLYYYVEKEMDSNEANNNIVAKYIFFVVVQINLLTTSFS